MRHRPKPRPEYSGIMSSRLHSIRTVTVLIGRAPSPECCGALPLLAPTPLLLPAAAASFRAAASCCNAPSCCAAACCCRRRRRRRCPCCGCCCCPAPASMRQPPSESRSHIHPMPLWLTPPHRPRAAAPAAVVPHPCAHAQSRCDGRLGPSPPMACRCADQQRLRGGGAKGTGHGAARAP